MNPPGESEADDEDSDGSTDSVDSDIEDDEDVGDEDTFNGSRGNSAGIAGKPRQYNQGPVPTALVDEVRGITDAFHQTLKLTAEKYNRPLHQILRLANLGDSIQAKQSPNPFNGYARKQALAGLPKR